MSVLCADICGHLLFRKRLQELDAKILLHPMRAHEGTAWELVVHDPDGIRIHVVQRPDGPYD